MLSKFFLVTILTCVGFSSCKQNSSANDEKLKNHDVEIIDEPKEIEVKDSVYIQYCNLSKLDRTVENSIFREWTNGDVDLNFGEQSLAFVFHGQCVGFYPLEVINDSEVLLIWDPEFDCKFDPQTSETFGLEDYPTKGKPFARYKVVDGTLEAEYFYPEWIGAYSDNVNDEVFTDKYYVNESDY